MRTKKSSLLICQIACMQSMYEKPGLYEFLWNVVHRITWAFYWRWKFLIKSLPTKSRQRVVSFQNASDVQLMPGDLVRVKEKAEILDTLNNRNELKGCAFMDEMEIFCGSIQRVFKRVDKFIDERDYRVKRCNGIVLLEDVICEGTIIFGKCDRSCFFFWREEWLEKISS